MHTAHSYDDARDLTDFLCFARAAETAIIKSGRSTPTPGETRRFSERYWRAVELLHDRYGAMPADWATSESDVQAFVDLTLRCEPGWRSRYKPHGYPGDYRLMELFYALEEPMRTERNASKAKPPGEQLVEAAFAAAHGVRLIQKRARILEKILLERMVRNSGRLSVLDVGGGGAKYYRRAAARTAYRPLSYTILDHDPSLPLFWKQDIDADVARNVSVISAPVKVLMNGGHPQLAAGTYDMILSSGLFDYLEQDEARKLAARLFSLLRHGGTLVIANILDSEPAQAAFFRETLLDWKLVGKTDEEMQHLLPIRAKKYERVAEVDLGIVWFLKDHGIGSISRRAMALPVRNA